MHELTYTEAEFKRIFMNSPILRARRGGYLRNIALVLGQQRNSLAIVPLIHTLESDPDPIVRGAAAWALGEIDGKRVKDDLQAALINESDPYVTDEINQVLDKVGNN
jgi:epoxyqueuosine reductase